MYDNAIYIIHITNGSGDLEYAEKHQDHFGCRLDIYTIYSSHRHINSLWPSDNIWHLVYFGSNIEQSSMICCWIHRLWDWPVESPHKESIMRKVFPCHDFIMSSCSGMVENTWVNNPVSSANMIQAYNRYVEIVMAISNHFKWILSLSSIINGCLVAVQHLLYQRNIDVTSHERHGVSNHCLFMLPPKKISNIYIAGPMWEEYNGDQWIPHTKGQ